MYIKIINVCRNEIIFQKCNNEDHNGVERRYKKSITLFGTIAFTLQKKYQLI